MTEPDNDFLQKRIDSFVFENDTRIQNVCKDDDIITVGDLVNRSEAELLRMPNAGSKCLSGEKLNPMNHL
jgi:DNA-directed RNA polymerase alpha subunit